MDKDSRSFPLVKDKIGFVMSESLMTRRGQLSLLRILFLNHRIWKQKSIVNKYSL
jgi:hypothetical protein